MPLFWKSPKKKVEDDSSPKKEKDYNYPQSVLDFYTTASSVRAGVIFMEDNQLKVAIYMMKVLREYNTRQLNTIIVNLKTVEDNEKIKTLLEHLHTLNHFKYVINTFNRFYDVPNSNDEIAILKSMNDYINDKVKVAAKQVVNSLIVFNPSELDRFTIIDKFSFGEDKENINTANMGYLLN